VRLRLYHAPDGARVAYREAGTGPGLVLLHSALLSHRELEPAVEYLVHRYRVILPDEKPVDPEAASRAEYIAEGLRTKSAEQDGEDPLEDDHAGSLDRDIGLVCNAGPGAGTPSRVTRRIFVGCARWW